MVSINKLAVVAGLLISGVVSSPVGANTPAFADIPEVPGGTKAGNKPIKIPKPKKEEKPEQSKSGLDKFISGLSDVQSLAEKLQTPEGQSNFVNEILQGVNGMIGEAAGAATESLESAVDEEIATGIDSILKNFGMGSSGGKGKSPFGGLDLSKFMKF